MNRFHVRPLTSLLVLTGLFAATACDDDDPVGPLPIEPDGLEVLAGETALVEVDGPTVTGEITVAEGEDTGSLTIRFLDDEGDAIQLEDEHRLIVEIDDEGVATFEADEADEFAGSISGVAAGTTTVVFRLMSGEGAGAEELYASPEIDIVVE